MNAAKTVNQALKNVTACFSCKGHDFCCEQNRSYVKKTTNRSQRRLNKALANEAY